MGSIIEIDTSRFVQPLSDMTIKETRRRFCERPTSKVTIVIQAFNGLEKTKRCVESLLKYTSDVDYDILFIDSGSSDGTFEFFKSVDFEKKTILHLSENKGAPLPWTYIDFGMLSEYVCLVNNDLVLTQNWLKNLLIVMESDARIGMVNPVSSNVGNFQEVKLDFIDAEDMQRKAAAFNVSDATKWQERLRLITLGTLFRKECLLAIGMPMFDVGFTHNFGDDDATFRARRAGYKAILAGDTWIHHDDEKLVQGVSPERGVQIQRDLDEGGKKFKEKYFGIDAWYDVGDFIPDILTGLVPIGGDRKAKIFGLDVKCGTRILEVKNYLRTYGIFNTECFSYSCDAKYLMDLQTICGMENVHTGDVDGFSDYYEKGSFSYVMIGKDINTYPDPFRIIKTSFDLLKPGGQLFFGLYNTLNLYNFVKALGRTGAQDQVHAMDYSVEDLVGTLKEKKYNVRFICARRFQDDESIKEAADLTKKAVGILPVNDKEEALFRLFSERYYFAVTK